MTTAKDFIHFTREAEITRAYERAMRMGFYITQRGEGRIWILHSPNGRTIVMKATRKELLETLPHILFE